MTANRSFPWPRLVFSRGQQDEPSGRAGPERAGDDTAVRFRLLVLPHLDVAYGYARYLARDGAAAEDIVQEAFLRAWKGYANCRGNEKSWLLAVVRNCFHDWARANKRFVVQTDPLEQIAELAGDDEPEEVLLRALDMTMLRDTITSLPEPFRETLVLRELEELSYREIATLTGTPIGTVMSRLARARDMLGKLLLDQNKGALG